MPVLNFHCPYCTADLKIRAEEVPTSPVDCPDCHKPIVLSRDAEGKVSASMKAAAGETLKKSKSLRLSTPATVAPTTHTQTNAAHIDSRPWSSTATRGVAAGVFGVTALLIAGAIFWMRSPADKTASTPSVDTVPTEKSLPTPPAGKNGTPTAASPNAVASTLPAVPTPQSRLAGLGGLISQYRTRESHFPAVTSKEGAPGTDRLSWLAELTATVITPNRSGVNWAESWRSPQNERFVRQRIPEFLNPSVDRLVGAENYPTTHFAGVAGVGADAADLPIDNPRAGIFGNKRVTRIADIRDGTSNTMMVVGVTNDLGSWAASGKATVRALTREPYINGPDGIGTGSPDRMLVLKADGSVQEVSAATDPRILRRMAAMADGLPLDPKVPGEPGEKAAPASGPQAAPPKPGNNLAGTAPSASSVATRDPIEASRPKPLKPAAPPPPPKVKLADALAQKIVRFEQAKPVPLRSLLDVLEELLTVPIGGDVHEIADLDDLLRTPVTVDLQNTTVGAILTAALAPARLTYAVEGQTIRLHKLAAAP